MEHSAFYDYNGFITKLLKDILKGIVNTTDRVKVVRSKEPINNGYFPVIDFYYSNQNPAENYEYSYVVDLLKEMKSHTSSEKQKM